VTLHAHMCIHTHTKLFINIETFSYSQLKPIKIELGNDNNTHHTNNV
jgi:hypothetical protein